ncbi:MAG: DNA translocase FtsK [Planctomycetota bacterium]
MTTAAATADPAAVATDMPRQVRLRRDVPGLLLIALTLLTLVSVATHDPADPVASPAYPLSELYQPHPMVHPLNDSVTNACGSLGALLSSMILEAVGIGVVVLIAGAGGVATALLGRGYMNAPVLRSLGGCVILVALTTAAAMLPLDWPKMPVVGNGGYLGAMTSTLLLTHFHPTGTWILTLAMMAIGLLLTTDYMLVGVGQRVVLGGASVSRKGFARAAAAVPVPMRRRRQPFTDLESPILIDGDRVEEQDSEPDDLASTPTIKFHTPKKRNAAADRTGADSVAGDARDRDTVSAIDPDAFDEDEYEEYEDEDGDPNDEELEPSVTRELDLEDEPASLRQDPEPRDVVPKPHIKIPRKRETASELDAAMQEMAGVSDYALPSLDLLEGSDGFDYQEQHAEALEKSVLLQRTIESFGYKVQVTNVEIGPVIAQYEIELEAGLRLNKISALADDLAIALRVPSVRVVAPIPGKNTVGIEVPNEIRQVVRLRDVIEESDARVAKMNIPVFLGKDVSGEPMPVDLAKMPHLLIAGRTGTGKSVCLNAIITSILMTCRPDEVRMLMIDPKMVELSGYGQLPHLMHPVITDMKKAEAILGWAVEKMEERYSLLAKVGVRHINSFNDLGRDEVLRRLEVDEEDGPTDVPEKLPFIVIVADEMADLMMTAGKDVEQHIIRLAQKSRAVGIHLILATQKPTVDVITGLIKSNLPARLSFQVASKTDSRVVLDENGADKLLGNGDMLFLWPGTSTLIRGQGTFLSDAEIERVCEQCSSGGQQDFVGELMNLKVADESGGQGGDLDVESLRKKDDLYESAIEVVIREGRGSLSLIQRCLGIGYGRAARLIDYMAEDGIVGQYNGSKSREVLVSMSQWQAMQGIEVDDEDDPVASNAAAATHFDEPTEYEYEEEYEDVD